MVEERDLQLAYACRLDLITELSPFAIRACSHSLRRPKLRRVSLLPLRIVEENVRTSAFGFIHAESVVHAGQIPNSQREMPVPIGPPP